GLPAFLGPSLPSTACYHQVAKPHLADGSRSLTERLVSEMTLPGRGCEQGRAVAEFRHIVMPDGRAWALHDGLRAVLPGRFTVGQPAAVARHTPMALRCEAPP